MSRKRNSNRVSMALLHSIVPCPSIEEYECEYYRPGCYCIPQAMPHVAPYTCAYLHDYVPQWTAACHTATYVVDAYGMVYYLSDFEHQLQFPNNMVHSDIVYHIPNFFDGQDYEVATEEDESETVSPRKRERLENENDSEDMDPEYNKDFCQDYEFSDVNSESNPLKKSNDSDHEYLVEEPSDSETKV
uniref:Uncharacterized protein n=1 Tax=Bactrocera dorsalis TaxID=27457 RepID=A0A034V204_BACDO